MVWIILILKVLLALAFAAAGVMKLKGTPALVEQFAEFGFPPAWMYGVGVVELAGAVGLFVGPSGVWACIGLALLMVGAVVNHLKVGHPPAKWRPAAMLLIICVVLAALIAGQEGRL